LTPKRVSQFIVAAQLATSCQVPSWQTTRVRDAVAAHANTPFGLHAVFTVPVPPCV
jgi:hypothetical protein